MPEVEGGGGEGGNWDGVGSMGGGYKGNAPKSVKRAHVNLNIGFVIAPLPFTKG